MSMVIARKIYDLKFFDKVRAALKLQGRIPDKISNDIRLVVVGNPKHAAQWTIPRPFRGILKKAVCCSVAAGVDSLVVPPGKIWELVGWRVGFLNGASEDITYDDLTIDGNVIADFMEDSGDVSHMPIATGMEHIIIGGQTPVGSTTGVATASYFQIVVDTLLNLFYNMPLLVRNEISLEWYGVFADASVCMVIWYYERNIESWETIQKVNR